MCRVLLHHDLACLQEGWVEREREGRSRALAPRNRWACSSAVPTCETHAYIRWVKLVLFWIRDGFGTYDPEAGWDAKHISNHAFWRHLKKGSDVISEVRNLQFCPT